MLLPPSTPFLILGIVYFLTQKCQRQNPQPRAPMVLHQRQLVLYQRPLPSFRMLIAPIHNIPLPFELNHSRPNPFHRSQPQAFGSIAVTVGPSFSHMMPVLSPAGRLRLQRKPQSMLMAITPHAWNREAAHVRIYDLQAYGIFMLGKRIG